MLVRWRKQLTDANVSIWLCADMAMMRPDDVSNDVEDDIS